MIVAITAPTYPNRLSEFILNLVHESEYDQSWTYTLLDRRYEFLRGRALFRFVTNETAPLLNAGDGAPIWPSSNKGSISHRDGVVVFASPNENHYVGIDLERVGHERHACLEATYKFLTSCRTSDELGYQVWRRLTLSDSPNLIHQQVCLDGDLVSNCFIYRLFVRQKEYVLVLALSQSELTQPLFDFSIIDTSQNVNIDMQSSPTKLSG